MDIFAWNFSKIHEMKKLIVGIFLLGCMCACGGGQKKTETIETVLEEVDSLIARTDTLWMEEGVEEAEPELPAKADESFDDFLYNFAIDEKLQITRVLFPLSCYTDNQKDSLTEETWVYDPLFSRLESYTVLFDKTEDMELEKDTALTSARIEWVHLKEHRLKRYYFERVKGEWMLEAIDDAAMIQEKAEQEDFYEFYARFVNDSLFQSERVTEPLMFVTIDPEDEFHVLETTLEKGQWFAFQPSLSKDILTNVSYGQHLDRNSKSRIIELKGFGNGFYNTLHFRCRNGQWMLTRFEDLGD